MSKTLKSQRGSAVILSLVLITVALVAFAAAGSFSVSNYVSNKKVQNLVLKKHALRELKTIISAPGVCINSLRVDHNNNTYTFNGLLNNQNNPMIDGASIDSLFLSNRVNIVANIWEADFNIRFDFGNAMARLFDSTEVTTRVRYTLLANGTVSDCGLAINSEEACRQLGLSWDIATQQCDICASMGGALQNGVCRL